MTPKAKPAAADRIAFSIDEAYQMIGCGRRYFYEHVYPEIRTVRVGRRTLVPRAELEAWIERHSERIGA